MKMKMKRMYGAKTVKLFENVDHFDEMQSYVDRFYLDLITLAHARES